MCRNISEIRLCMETGRVVILLNLENLYESLYDVLNQVNMHFVRYVKVTLNNIIVSIISKVVVTGMLI